MTDDRHVCCQGHCCVIHGCKYGMDDCPVATGQEEQAGACEECGLEREGYYGEPMPEFDDAPYGCPRCSSTRIVFDSKYDIPEGQRPVQGDPVLKFVLCLACKYEGQWAEFKGHKERLVRDPPMKSEPDVPADDLDMGVVYEGVLEYDREGHWIVGEKDGQPCRLDVREALERYEGQKVRFVLVTFDTIDKVAKLVAQGGMRIEDAIVGKSG